MKKTNYFLAILLAAGMMMSGCSESFLNNDPTTSITPEKIAEDPSGVRSLIEGIHNIIYTYYFGDQLFAVGQPALNIHYDMLGDDFINTMIAYLRGTVLLKQAGQIIIETGGVGYEVSVPLAVLERVHEGQEAALFVHHAVRDDGLLPGRRAGTRWTNRGWSRMCCLLPG